MRTHYCGTVTETDLQKTVSLCGWVNRRRDHGGVIFVDLRDKSGLMQVVFNPELSEMFQFAETVRNEYVLRVTGTVRHRPEGTINPELPTGHFEVVAATLEIFNAVEPLPFLPSEHQSISEEVRLKYRYLDLRRPEMFERLQLRARIIQQLHQFLSGQGFIEVETPYLTKATPEGSRDYLVPSRVHPGEFYALPQSPQIFKELLMIGGLDRYYQVVRCFRDEDLRADRQPEFTQLDIETSFMDQESILVLFEEMMRQVFQKALNITLPNPFPRLTFTEAMRRYGSDKPDLRIPLELVDVNDLVKTVDFKVFADAANDSKGRVAALRLPRGCELLTRKQLDEYGVFVGQFGAKGLAYIKVNDRTQGVAGLQSPILKFLPEPVLNAILERVQAQTGDIIFFGADKASIVNDALGALRVKLGHDCQLLTSGWEFLWVIDFPMFEPVEGGGWHAYHHPFTLPRVDSIEALLADPGAHLSHGYDMVLNGTELGGGSIRIHQHDLQLAVLSLLGIDREEAYEKFGHLLQAIKSGCPPLGGIAFGLDRLVMLMTGANSLREVIAFPKTQSASCPLTNAPTKIPFAQLHELHLKVT